MAIFITSDLHLNHDKEFLYRPRGFSSIEEMNKAIVNNFNSILDPDDDLYILGDLILVDNSAVQLIKNLKCKNIHIIRGNHDSDVRIELYRNCWNVVEICDAKFLRYGKHHFFLSHYPSLTSNWNESKKLSSQMINLCGHTHTQDKFRDFDKGLIYHCELDAHNCYPVNIDTIITDIQEKIDEDITPEINRWSQMSILELKNELEQLQETTFSVGKENSFKYQFKLNYLKKYIKEDK